MKFYLALYLAILKAMSGTSNIIKSESISNTTSYKISCYSCAEIIHFNHIENLYNSNPDYFKNNIFCTSKSDVKIEQVDVAKFLCAINIETAEDFPYKIRDKAKKVFINFTFREKNECLLDKSLPTDTVCLETNCRLLYKCCDTNLCNNAEAFKLRQLAVYSNPQDQNLKNSYSRYTNTKCRVSSIKDKSIAKNQPCIVVADNNISNIIKTMVDTPKNNAGITKLTYSILFYLILFYQSVYN